MRGANEKKRVLITAFMPFGGDSLNPTETALAMLPGTIGGATLEKLLLPVEFKRAAELAAKGFERLSPAAVIMLGQAGGRKAVTPELYAKNVMDARIPDNAGYKPEGIPIAPDGAERLSSTLPVNGIVEAIRSAGIPAEVSQDAGTYVCNALMYSMLRLTEGKLPAGFIHVPFIREQVEGVPAREGTAFMELDDILKAVNIAISTVIGTL